MSGFSPAWLALREPVDHRSRNGALAASLSAALADRAPLSVVDLGAGTGSNLRALAPGLGLFQSWRLVDHDPALIEAARARLSAWADEAHEDGATLRLLKNGRRIEVAFMRADLAANVEAALGEAPDLVTAAALFDLASPAWIARVAGAVAARRAAFHTALTYDGTEVWHPPHPADAAMLAAFHAHQRRDKGFGPAAGPEATAALAKAFAAQGYRIETGPSPWRVGPDEAALIAALADGAAGAVRETGLVPEATIAGWLAVRRSGAACTVGHVDLLALPGR
ncbi:class I SAM-dependent methyltransferase [Salinarimonas soli]|uniref:Class I SAM-dependent methyltransferase n=1 Tax=Salinarimonas soli TaxID=1638099 RepID=A0A5B2VUP3_9HYPH|nr:class I SAM-dependent methyltransferase [Salinarimonas soli]KAA2242358.1 class I SAM-dependent methyltransferase [Salinarimonas soli]